MRVVVWGARGAVPTPGPATNRYGGNTSCLEITLSDGTLLVLDAGSGIRTLGLRLAAESRRIDILLTHLHLDHIQGLLFFAPLFVPDAENVVWGPSAAETLPERLARYLSPPLTPLHLHDLPARLSFAVCPEGEWEIGPARIQVAPVTHPGPTLGYLRKLASFREKFASFRGNRR
jgi:phosphoribosyl 1,2-cyclic phosphodiesterase